MGSTKILLLQAQEPTDYLAITITKEKERLFKKNLY